MKDSAVWTSYKERSVEKSVDTTNNVSKLN